MTPENLAILIWLLVAAVPVLVAIRLLFRRPYSPLQWSIYYYIIAVVRILWRARLPRRLPIEKDQGAVIICNHRSSIDPLLIQVAAGPRLVHWMVAQIYGKSTLIGWLLRLLETIPVERKGRDLSALKTAIRLAARGELIGMLPEGRINTTDDLLLKVRPGFVFVALKARVPVLPCYIEGAPYHEVLWRPLFMRARAQLKVGRPIDLSEYYGREREEGLVAQLTRECVKEIAQLAGREDFEPDIAGREWMQHE